ncbi:MAG TPA: nucleotide sugar dehydrogenase [Nitrospirae bacterium]|nr:UDP-N-acetyl-D-glucosamine 6-dehydrogenase [bacterium BMS3Abin10]GBE39240.1 UDP-N-acetyl-D-glucosamine 6-dehydrogenase [bacterium BMS3Bbin08]HDH50789.1 nucleotide sugar dehydrogenase [Nitrospirota bacterium]HDK81549.1 nucleotide sugar dehydrogenase [Nitrospirota bacterium]HDO25138.1 nucleotide sugar dehydrogenase [Nitrospirota bacterium]
MIRDYSKKKKLIAVVGLGYVGLPLAVELAKKFRVIGFDIKKSRIKELSSGKDSTGEVSKKDLRSVKLEFTHDPVKLSKVSVIIVAVPTPINRHNMPDLLPLESASRLVGKNMSKGAVVVYESTVYPGVTEDICVPILEERSGMTCGREFKIGYSPERMNPGDKAHSLINIVKVVSAQDKKTTDLLAGIYGAVVKAGIHKAPDIKTAEAAKVIENIQRDLNIALVNELAIIFNKMGIDTKAVLDASSTKWNFLPFRPGLVGGHCIGVDPYYLTFKAQAVGYHPEVILSGRRINDNMGKYIADITVKQMIGSGRPVKNSKVLILGLTFKENIGDIRNTRVIDIYNELKKYGVKVFVHDPYADSKEVHKEYRIPLLKKPEDKKPFDGIILAVKHRVYRKFTPTYLKKLCNGNPVLIDIRSFYDKARALKAGFHYWRL